MQLTLLFLCNLHQKQQTFSLKQIRDVLSNIFPSLRLGRLGTTSHIAANVTATVTKEVILADASVTVSRAKAMSVE